MKQVNIHKLWEKHTFPAIENLCIKCILPVTISYPCWPLDQDLGQCSMAAPRPLGQGRGGTKPSWSSGLLDAPSPHPALLTPGVDRSIPLGTGQHAREGEAGVGGLASLYLREENHHSVGRERDSSWSAGAANEH